MPTASVPHQDDYAALAARVASLEAQVSALMGSITALDQKIIALEIAKVDAPAVSAMLAART